MISVTTNTNDPDRYAISLYDSLPDAKAQRNGRLVGHIRDVGTAWVAAPRVGGIMTTHDDSREATRAVIVASVLAPVTPGGHSRFQL